jgi:hypothetical protein
LLTDDELKELEYYRSLNCDDFLERNEIFLKKRLERL